MKHWIEPNPLKHWTHQNHHIHQIHQVAGLMVEMRMAREREMAAMLRIGGVNEQMGNKFWKGCFSAETDPRSNVRPDQRPDPRKFWAEPKLFVATPPQQQLDRTNCEEVILFSVFFWLCSSSHLVYSLLTLALVNLR